MRKLLQTLPVLLALALCSGLLPRRGNAIPAFARLYGTSCMTFHIDFPKLNDFGKAFKDAGFKFPKPGTVLSEAGWNHDVGSGESRLRL